MDTANGIESAADDDDKLYTTGLDLIRQFQGVLDKMKSKQRQKLLLHFSPGSGAGKSGQLPGAASPVIGSNNASSSLALERERPPALVVTEPSELKLLLKLNTWMSDTGLLIVQPSLVAENGADSASKEQREQGDGPQLDCGSSSSSSSSSSCGDAGNGDGGDAVSHSSSGSSSCNGSSNISADGKSGSQQRQAAPNSSGQQQQQQPQTSGDLPQQADSTRGGRSLYKDLGVIQGQQKQRQQHQQKHHQQQQQQQQQLKQIKQKQQEQQQLLRARITGSGGRISKKHYPDGVAGGSSANASNFQRHNHKLQQQKQQKQKQLQDDLENSDKEDKKVTKN